MYSHCRLLGEDAGYTPSFVKAKRSCCRSSLVKLARPELGPQMYHLSRGHWIFRPKKSQESKGMELHQLMLDEFPALEVTNHQMRGRAFPNFGQSFNNMGSPFMNGSPFKTVVTRGLKFLIFSGIAINKLNPPNLCLQNASLFGPNTSNPRPLPYLHVTM